MDNDEPQRQLLLLIRELSAEKTRGERRLSDLKKRLLELQSDYKSANAELEKTKLMRETVERELRGSQAQLDRTNASLIAMETRNSRLQDEISQVSSELQAIKNDGKIQRDEFIKAMHELNSKIREFNEKAFHALKKGHPDMSSDTDQGMDAQSENTLKDVENEISSMDDAEMLALKEEYQKIACDVNKVHEEVANLTNRVSLSEAIVLKSERLKELSGQISELEKTNSSLQEELQKKYVCPKCQFNNMETCEWPQEAEETTAN